MFCRKRGSGNVTQNHAEEGQGAARNIDLLIVDDDPDFRASLARRFLRRGYRTEQAADANEALALLERRQFDVAILDMVMPGMSGLELLKLLKQANPDCEAIMLTGQGTIETAVEAMKQGAFDYLTKPFPLSELEARIEKAAERRQLTKENEQLKAVLQRNRPVEQMVGQSPAMQEVYRLVRRAGPTDKAILIQGESGTGKELVARALHEHSQRANRPMVVINCAALPEPLLESEMFGHEKGAFTGAVAAKPGLFEVADGSTLFIDEIGELAPSLQAKLLRVLEDGSLRRVGSLKERRVNVRLLAATNRNLEAEVRAGRFRQDLYYRINVMSLELPPLRERNGDVRLLIDHFLGPDWSIEPQALAAMQRYDWPGNVRELANAIERAKILADDHIVHLHDLPRDIVRSVSSETASEPAAVADADALASIQRAHIIDVLRRTGGNKARAARKLGISRRSLYRLIDKYDIQPVTADV